MREEYSQPVVNIRKNQLVYYKSGSQVCFHSLVSIDLL